MSRKEWPPFLRKNKEESPTDEHETLILAPAPAALDAKELINYAYRGDAAAAINELDSFYEGMRSYASHRELYADPRVRAMHQRKQEATTLAIKLSQASESEKPSIASQLENAIDALTQQASEVEIAAESNEARNSTSQESTPNEERVAFKEAVQSASAETESLLKQHGPVNAFEELVVDSFDAPIDQREDETLELTEEQELKEEPAIAAEPREGNASSIRNIDRASAAVATEKHAMNEAEQEYLAAYKNYHKKITARGGKEPKKLKALSNVFNQTRFEYRDALDEQATHRIKDKIQNGSMDKAAGDKLLERYDRMVMYREVIRPAAEKRYQARLEAKGESHTATFKSGMGWLGRKNQEASRWLEEKTGSKNGAKFARAVATTVVVGGAAATVGAFGAAGVMAALGWGTLRIARSLASTALGAAVGEAAAQAYGATIGSKREEKRVRIKAEADAELASESRAVPERAQALNFSSIDDLEAYDVQRQALLGDADERNLNKLEQEKMLVRAVSALVVGAGTSALLSHLPSGEELVAEAGSKPEVIPDSERVPQPSPIPTETPEPAEAPVAAEIPVPAEIRTPAEPVPVATPKPHIDSPTPKVIDIDKHQPAPRVSVPEEGRQIDPSAPIFVPEQDNVDPELPEQSVPAIEAPVAEPAITTTAEATPTPLPEGVDPEVPDSPVEVASEAESLPAETAEVSNDTLPTEISEATRSPIQPEDVTSVAPATELPPESVNNDISAEPPVESHSSSAAEQIETGTSDNAELANPVDQTPDAAAESGISTDADSSATESSASSTLESFTNKKGVLIDPSKPHLYQVNEKGAPIVWGGTFEQRYATAINTFNQPGNTIRQIALEGKDIDPQTGKPVLGQLVVGDDGSLGTTPALKERYGGFLGLFTKTRPMIPDPDTFTKRIK